MLKLRIAGTLNPHNYCNEYHVDSFVLLLLSFHQLNPGRGYPPSSNLIIMCIEMPDYNRSLVPANFHLIRNFEILEHFDL